MLYLGVSISYLFTSTGQANSSATASPFTAFSLGANKDANTSKPSETSGAGRLVISCQLKLILIISGFSATSGPTPAIPTTAPSAGTSVPAPSMLRGKTVEDIVNRWTSDLETHTREFSQFASEVAVWDRTLIENGNYVRFLYPFKPFSLNFFLDFCLICNRAFSRVDTGFA